MLKTSFHPVLTLCATELQARLLRADYNRAQSELGRQAWESPATLSLSRWIREQWLATWPHAELVSRSKERWLWTEILQADSESQGLLAPDILAEQMMRCWKLCHEWTIDVGAAPSWSTEQQLYARLSRQYHGELQKRGWITDAEIGAVVLQKLRDEEMPKPQATASLRFHGFYPDNCPPRDRKLLQQLGFEFLSAPSPTHRPQQKTASSPNEQWDWLASDISALLAREPSARIVIAVPQLHRHAEALEIHWLPKLAPASIHAAEAQDIPWIIERPLPLGHLPAVGAFLDICQLAPRGMDFDTIARVLRQPLLLTPDERQDMALLENSLRREGLIFSSNDLLPHNRETESAPLIQRLQALKAIVDEEPRFASGHDWAQHWRKRWQAMPLIDTNAHWALREDLQQALTAFASLGDEMGAMSRSRALTTLQHVLGDHFHSPRQRRDIRVRICEAAQADDLPCTHRFVVHLDAHHFPSARPQMPWLNPELLERASVPQASPARWLHAQRSLLQRLCLTEPACTLYCCSHDEQGTPLAATPLLPTNEAEAETDSHTPHADGTTPALEWPEHDNVEKLDRTRLQSQRGGSALLRRQSASPFAAFVYHRLASKELGKIPQGLAADRQGQWVHAVLAEFWAEVRSSAALAALGPEQVVDKVELLVAASAPRYLPRNRFGDELQWLEADRVLRLCSRWVEHERKRTDPFEVIHCEQAFTTEHQGLKLRLQLDRLDCVQTEFGPRHLVIDYKTGQADMTGWRGTRLREPQLPLYASTPDLRQLHVASIDGICFARVDEHRPALLAATNWCERLTEDSIADKAWKYTWDEELESWQQQLEALVQSYADGEIRHRVKTSLARDFALRACAFLVDQHPEEAENEE